MGIVKKHAKHLRQPLHNKRLLFFLIAFVISTVSVASAFESSTIGLHMPSIQPAPSIVFNFEHRFYSSIVDTPVQTKLFGLGSGVKAAVSAKATIWKGFFLDGKYYFSDREFSIYAGYSHQFIPNLLAASGEIGYFNYGSTKRSGSYFILGAVSMPMVFSRFSPVANIAWDGETTKMAAGIGLTVKIIDPLDFSIDYTPIVTAKPTRSFIPLPVYSTGFVYKTYHHQFFLFVSNSNGVTWQKKFRGAEDYEPRIGFIITRLIDFN